MSSKEAVLAYLEQNRGTYVSGELMAGRLEITRAAIWRAIKDLRADGHAIESSTKVGYRLSIGSDVLRAQSVLLALASYHMEQTPLWYHPVIDSTNREAKRLALEGASHGSVVIAGNQIEGRGRNGRSFYSPQESGFYLSMLLRPDVETSVALRVTCAAAVAVCRAITETCKIDAQIKWVNDIYIGGLKVCGILTEGVGGLENGRLESIVVGIGVNHTVPKGGFPEELRGIAGAIYPEGEVPPVTRSELAAAIIAQLRTLSERLDERSFMDEYRERSLVIGREVSVIHGSACYEAKVTGINDNGALLVRLADSTEQVLQSGEISLRPHGEGGW